MTTAPIRLGTRRSHLAMTQSTWVAEQLREIAVLRLEGMLS